jgi:nitrate reductase gamma subunit
MNEISAQLHFAEHRLQEVALAFMALVYLARILWFLRHKAGGERQPTTARNPTARRRGILYSWANVAMPWAMESTRRMPFLYVQFVLFHLGVTAAITLSFIIPYAPGVLETSALVVVFRVLIWAAFAVGLLRMARRIRDPYIRAISSPDDFFAVFLLTVWFFFAALAVPDDVSGGEGTLLAFFWLTAFFLVYVPFSKISHYLYYPFTRYYLGKSLGYRGVYPVYRVQGS